MPPLDPTPSHRGAILNSHDASPHNRPTKDARGAQQGKPAGAGSHRGAIRGSHDASPHNPQTNQVRDGRTQDPGGWKEPAQVTAGQAAAPHSRSGPVIRTEHLVAGHLAKAGVVPAHNGKPHGHSAPDANKQPVPASANHPDAKSDANKPTTQPGRQTVSPSAVRADQAKSNANSGVPVPATVSVTTFKSWLLTFERPVSDDEVAKWLFPTGNVPEGFVIRVPEGFVIRVHGNGSDPSQQWDVSYSDWKGNPKGDSIDRMAQFRDLFTPYGLDLVDRAWLGGEPTPQEAAEIKASNEKKAREDAIRNDRIIPALNMSAGEALKRMKPGAYELNGNFVWIGYKTSGRRDVRAELQIVATSATNPVFNNDMRFYLRHGLDLNDAILAFNEQWDEIFNIELAFAGIGAGYQVRDPASSAAARAAGAAGYAGLEGRLALNRAMSAVKKPESVVILTEVAEKLAVRGEQAAGRIMAAKRPSQPLSSGPATIAAPKPEPSKVAGAVDRPGGTGAPGVAGAKNAPGGDKSVWVQLTDGRPREYGPSEIKGDLALRADVQTPEGAGRVVARGEPPHSTDVRQPPHDVVPATAQGPTRNMRVQQRDAPAAATPDTKGSQPAAGGDVKKQGASEVEAARQDVVSGTIEPQTVPPAKPGPAAGGPSIDVPRTAPNDDTEIILGTLGLAPENFRDLAEGRRVSGTMTRGQAQLGTRFRYDGNRLTASVISADNPPSADRWDLAREFIAFRHQSINLGKKLGAKVVRLEGEMVGEQVATFLKNNHFEPVPGMDGIWRLDIPIK